MGLLFIDRGERQGEIIHLTLEKTVLGRHPEFCDEIISKNEAVSRKHAQIVCVNDRHYLEDLKSRNRTYLNEVELAPFTRSSLDPQGRDPHLRVPGHLSQRAPQSAGG